MKTRYFSNLLLIAAFVLFGTAACGQQDAKNTNNGNPSLERADNVHRIATCNIRVALPDDEKNGNGWSVRKAPCIATLRDMDADIYCFQEVLEVQERDLRGAFPDYMLLGFAGPEMDNQPKDGGYYGIGKNPIMFSRERYEVVAAGTYWLSDEPVIGGSMAWGTARGRNCSWVRLRDNRSGVEFRVLSVHLDHISAEARQYQIDFVLKETGQYPAYLPQVLAGDFNSSENSNIAKSIKAAGWTDTFEQANPGVVREGTTHKFNGQNKPTGPIDFIYTIGGEVETQKSAVVDSDVDGVYPSDHFFVYSDILIK